MNPLDPQGEPENAPDPLDEVPDSIPAQLVKLDDNHDYDVGVPDLTIRRCDFSLPPAPPDDPETLDLPDIDLNKLWSHRFSFASITAEILNEGPGDAGAFDVRFTVAMADWNEATGQFEIVGEPVVKQRTISDLRANHRDTLYVPLFRIERIVGRLYFALVEVNPITPDQPLGKVVENNYTNNRCGCTFFDHPGWQMPSEPIDLDTSLEPLTGKETWWVSRQRS